MGRKCMVPDCLSEEGRVQDRGVTFHKIPLHTDIRPKWMSLCHIPEDKYNVKVVYVCSRHFLKADFCNFKGKRYMLKQGVLPSVFPWSKLSKPASSVDGDDKKDQTEVNTDVTIKIEPKNIDDSTEQNSQAADNMKMDSNAKLEIKEEPRDYEETHQSSEQNIDGREPPLHKTASDVTQTTTGSDGGTNTKKETVNNSTPPVTRRSDSKQTETTRKSSSNSNVSNSSKRSGQKSSTTIEQQGKSVQTPYGALNFSLNARLEALDFNQMWFPARVAEIDYEESEVLIHFEKYSSKYDEWISMNSSRLRPLQPIVKKSLPESFGIGEKCLASWSDSRKFPAVVTKVIDKDTYEVLFNDGFVKILKGHRIAKADGKSVGSAPLFDPAKGTKQDRRDKKRKLNVAELFRKRPRSDTTEESAPHTTAANTTSTTTPSTTTATNSAEENAGCPQIDPEIWMPQWENGKPVGVDSVIETSDGMRKSTIVPDPRLPPDWQKHLTQRIHGASAGKWDTVIVGPEGRRFRTRAEIKVFLEENPQLNYNETMFNFSLNRRKRGVRRQQQHHPPVLEPHPTVAPPEPEPEENPNSLKIPIVDDAYRCPIDGCGKMFRRENLAQMHVKHYHPKYTKYLDSTPNVADLAYARTVGESLDKSPDRSSKFSQSKQTQKTVTPKASTSKVNVHSPSIEPEVKTPQQSTESTTNQKSKDSEILKLLNSKPSEEQTPKYPPGLPSNMYPDIKLKDLLNKSEGIPRRDELNLKSLSTSTSRPTGIKTLLPVVRTNDKKEIKTEDGQATEQESWPKSSASNRPQSVKQNVKRKRQISENTDSLRFKEQLEPSTSSTIKQELLPPPPPPPLGQSDQNSAYIVEGGEVIKIVRMKREEIINCTCGIMEEDGLMIQCELCLCWQHAYCNNIERENQVPDKYVCYICQNPVRQRSSKKYFYDQDWLKTGNLAVGSYHCKDNEVLKKRFEKLKKSHDLTGGLLELKDFMHTLKVKLKIAESKNHPKLYLWSKPWDKSPLPEKLLAKEREAGSKSRFTDAENQLSKSEIDLLTNKTEAQNQTMLFSILKSTKDEPIAGFPKLDLNTLIENNLEQLPISAPQPEAAIESADCKLNLLDHIAHCQNLVEERLNDFEAQVEALDGGSVNTDEEFSRTCQTVQMLLRDLNTIKELSHSNSL